MGLFQWENTVHRDESVEQIQRQINIEEQYNRKHIDRKIREAIEANPDMQAKVDQGVTLVSEYMGKTYYPSKNARINQLQGMNIRTLVMDIFIGIAYCQREELFTSVSAQMAGRLKFSDKAEAIMTTAELLAVLCLTDAFDILKASRSASLMVISRIPLDPDLLKFIAGARYLPPMVCRPLELENNYSSGYLTHNDSLILGRANHHDGDICLDVLNLVNQVPLRLDTEFLSHIEEDPTREFTVDWAKDKALEKGQFISDAEAKIRVQKAIDHWHQFKGQCYDFYLLMAQYGNRFYLTHKVDKRGRIYSSGYHITTQGTPFKKAIVELADEELVMGVPDVLRLSQ